LDANTFPFKNISHSVECVGLALTAHGSKAWAQIGKMLVGSELARSFYYFLTGTKLETMSNYHSSLYVTASVTFSCWEFSYRRL